MSLLDFLIGFFLMNAMPHHVLGLWRGRMFSLFGFGNMQNIAYGLLNFAISISLFLYTYGIEGLKEQGIYSGALLLLIIYLLSGHFWRDLFHPKPDSK